MNDKQLQRDVDAMEWTLSHLVSKIEDLETNVAILEESLDETNDKPEAIKDL